MTQQRNALKVPLDSSAANLAVIQNTSDHPRMLLTYLYHVTTPSTADAGLRLYYSDDGVTPGAAHYNASYNVGEPTIGADPLVTGQGGETTNLKIWQPGQYLLVRAHSGDPAGLAANLYLRWTYLED